MIRIKSKNLKFQFLFHLEFFKNYKRNHSHKYLSISIVNMVTILIIFFHIFKLYKIYKIKFWKILNKFSSVYNAESQQLTSNKIKFLLLFFIYKYTHCLKQIHLNICKMKMYICNIQIMNTLFKLKF